MGSKRKLSRVFGKSTGKNKCRRQEIRVGRPKYVVTRGANRLSAVIKRLKPKRLQKYVFSSHIIDDGSRVKLRIKKVAVKELSPVGYRLINLDSLQSHVTDITMHACQCPKAIELVSKGQPPIKLHSEGRSLGLASVMAAECQGCNFKFKFSTSPTLPGSKRFDINVRAVWGSISTGNGPSHLNELLATMNSPGLSPSSFSSIEQEIGEWWLEALQENMLQAGAEERRLAIEHDSYHQGIPAITVITDGGWSKRTHKHTYNALGGVAIIIGKETKKLLHLGVRNKYCSVCSRAENNKKEASEHNCYKNWTADSQSMESDIIVDGFKQAEAKHGLRYMRVIGDGDSSVFAKIREEVPVWGRFVQKEECANHISKCYRSNLEKLVSENPLYKGKNHLTKATRVRLVSALRCAIRMRSKEVEEKKCSKVKGIRNLRHDIKNSVFHVFGKHSNCSDFCTAKKSVSDSTCSTQEENDTSCLPENDTDIFEEQHNLWQEGSSKAAQEEARCGTSIRYSNVEQYIIQDVSSLLSKIAEKADRLISNSTTNLAENWMHIRCKFDGGKIYNLCSRGSWHGRCYGGGLRMNYGAQWSPTVWEASTATKAGNYFTQYYLQKSIQLTSTNKHKAKPESQQRRWKRKMKTTKESNTKRARKSYGEEALDVTEDISQTELEKSKDEFLKKHINISATQMENISSSTLEQSQSGLWHTERRKRLTASNFGLIIRRKPSLPVTKLLRNLLYSTFKGNRHTKNGLLQERTSIEEYILKKADENQNVTVKSSGLIIDHDNPYLAASPDGIVSTHSGQGLLEIKNLLHSKPLNLYEAAGKASFCLKCEKGNLKLKENHNYFFQCHGLLNVCKYDWVDFVVRTLNPHQIFIQRITRDVNLWNNVMLPKLKAFYHSALLPELCSPRNGKVPGIREPGVWYIASAVRQVHVRDIGSAHTKKRPRSKRRHQRNDVSSDTDSGTAQVTELRAPSTRKRQSRVKFLGRRIKHEWITDSEKNTTEWYEGTVLNILSGQDGVLGTTYEILYDGDDEPFEINHLVEDYNTGSAVFMDV